MKILVLNCGSSSVKSQLIETSPELSAGNRDRRLAKVSVENIGNAQAAIHCEALDKPARKFSTTIPSHQEAVETAVQVMLGQLSGVLKSKEEIEGVGHRVVHGGERFTESVLMDEEAVRRIEESSELAPLHNPENLKGFHAARSILPRAKHVAVFDTSFHQTLPPRAYLYGLPYSLYSRYRIRKYGFHGTSHRYVSQRFAELQNAGPDRFKLITCHLGNGCSMSAVDHGRSVDTSMGFTPLEGLLMGTRAGDIDPAAVLYVMEKDGLSPRDAGRLLNNESGLYGLSGIGNDMRALLERSGQGDERARLAVEVFCYRIRKYIGAYVAALNGCGALVFTGGIGENAPPVRARICDSLDALGIRLDPRRNEQTVGAEGNITAEEGRVAVWVIPTNEELLIARDTARCIGAGRRNLPGL